MGKENGREPLARLLPDVAPDDQRQEQLRREQAARAKAESLARSNAQRCRQAEWAREQADQARAEAEAANSAKDDFLLMLSHELRTPLTPIFLWTGMLREPDLPRDVVARALDGIERAARSEVRLIEDLLDVSRIIAGKLHLEQQPVALAGVVEAGLEAVRSAAVAKSVAIDVAVAEALVFGDAHRLEQVVINLLVNAIKFSHQGGRVTIRVEPRGSEVQLSVRDTGRGIAPAFLRRVFKPFEQAETSTTRSHGGLGLGLTIVRHLVERHGGSVRAESAGLEKGATFTVTLPVWQVPATDPPFIDGERCDGVGDLSGLRILVVDDDRETGQGLETLLTSRGAETRAVVSGAQARTLLAQWPADLLISDIAMPEEDGYTLIHQIRALDRTETRPSRLPAIALTAYARTEDRRDALAAGFDGYVTKPVESRELLAAIATLVR